MHILDIAGIISLLILIFLVFIMTADIKKIRRERDYDINLPRNTYKYINIFKVATSENIDIYVDENTKVMYFTVNLFGDGPCGLSPIYNADGTLKLYEDDYKEKVKQIVEEEKQITQGLVK